MITKINLVDFYKMVNQWIYDKLSTTTAKGMGDQIFIKIVSKLRELIARDNSTLISYNIGSFSLSIPLSHDLGIYLHHYPNYSTNISRIAVNVQKKYENLTLIDIGANVGDTIAILRNKTSFPILAIEGEDSFFSILSYNCQQFSDIHLVKAYLSDSDQEVKTNLSFHGGTSSVSNSSDNDYVVSFKSLKNILEENPKFYNSKILKVDTDGYDLKIIQGAKDWLIDVQPILFFEYDPFWFSKQFGNGLEFFDYLSQINYRTIIIYNNFGDYMFSADLGNRSFLEEIDQYSQGKEGKFYYDICAFSEQDEDLFCQIRESELEHFKKVKGLE